MSAPSTQLFCVMFMASNCYKIALEAKSESQAIKKAQKLWATQGEERFTAYAGDTDAWMAEPAGGTQ